MPGETKLTTFLRDPRLVHWYTQNLDLDVPNSIGATFSTELPLPPHLADKLSPIPIGVDFHTLSEKLVPGLTFRLVTRWAYPLNPFGPDRVKWGMPFASKERQQAGHAHSPNELLFDTPAPTRGCSQAQIDRLVAQFPPNAARPVRALVNWSGGGLNQFERQRSGAVNRRTALLAQLPVGDHWEQRAGLPRLDGWGIHRAYAFVVCPPGNGLDTHRAWEALALHSIPIVLRASSRHDRLFQGLPVVLVASLGEVTLDNLRKWHKVHTKLFQNRHNMRRLESHYWEHAMLQRARTGPYVREYVREVGRPAV